MELREEKNRGEEEESFCQKSNNDNDEEEELLGVAKVSSPIQADPPPQGSENRKSLSDAQNERNEEAPAKEKKGGGGGTRQSSVEIFAVCAHSTEIIPIKAESRQQGRRSWLGWLTGLAATLADFLTVRRCRRRLLALVELAHAAYGEDGHLCGVTSLFPHSRSENPKEKEKKKISGRFCPE